MRGSIDYTLGEFARAVVETFREVCDAEGVPHPMIVSESGRAVTAYHSLLVVEAIGRREKGASADTLPRPAPHPLIEEAEALEAVLAAPGGDGAPSPGAWLPRVGTVRRQAPASL